MFQSVLRNVAQSLTEHVLPYMVVGGQAVLLYGSPRQTKDIDITLGVDAERLPEVLAAAESAGLRPLPAELEEFVRQTNVLPCEDVSSGIRVDFIFSFTPYERAAIERSARVSVKGVPVCFAAKEDVVIHKVVAGRPRDLEDVRTLLLKNPPLDEEYVVGWLKQFEESLGEPYVARFLELAAGDR